MAVIDSKRIEDVKKVEEVQSLGDFTSSLH
jgi:hypothetical protein